MDPNIRNMDLIPFLGALSSPSMMSPMRMLTRAYSISEKKTKTVQPDMNTSIAFHKQKGRDVLEYNKTEKKNCSSFFVLF